MRIIYFKVAAWGNGGGRKEEHTAAKVGQKRIMSEGGRDLRSAALRQGGGGRGE